MLGRAAGEPGDRLKPVERRGQPAQFVGSVHLHPAARIPGRRHVLGDREAERLAAAGDNVSGDRAREMGFLDRIVPAADLLDVAFGRARELAGRSRAAYAEIKRRARAETLARFDRATEGDPFLDFWFSEEAGERIAGLVARLTKKS